MKIIIRLASLLFLGFFIIPATAFTQGYRYKIDSAVSILYIATYPDSKIERTDTSYSIVKGEHFVVEVKCKPIYYGEDASLFGPPNQIQFLLMELNPEDKMVTIDDHGKSLFYQGHYAQFTDRFHFSLRELEPHEKDFVKLGDYFAQNLDYGWRLSVDLGHFQFGGFFDKIKSSRKYTARLDTERDFGFTPPTYQGNN